MSEGQIGMITWPLAFVLITLILAITRKRKYRTNREAIKKIDSLSRYIANNDDEAELLEKIQYSLGRLRTMLEKGGENE